MFDIKVATAKDVADLAQLARDTFAESFVHYPAKDLATFLERYTPEFFLQILSDQAERVWIVRDENRQGVGYAHAGRCSLPHGEVTSDCGELKRIYVRKGIQGAGLGSDLLRETVHWLGAPPRNIWLGVFSENIAAQRLYARYGFEKVGEYEFVVGDIRDREFILRRQPELTRSP